MIKKISYSKSDIYNILGVVFLFCLTNMFFNYKPLVLSDLFGNVVNLIVNASFVLVLFKMCLKKQKDNVSKFVAAILIMFAVSLIYPWIFWNQSVYYTFRSMGKLFPLCFFFLFQIYKVNVKQMTTAVLVLALIYSLMEIIAINTFPNNIIGFSDYLDTDIADSSLEQRGVIRLSIPGADFIVCAIFWVLNYFKNKKKWYVLLIPLFFMLMLRGTRTPLLVAALMTVVFIMWNIKNKLLIIIVCLFTYFTYQEAYNAALNSNSDNIIVKYVQLTDNQMDTGEEDIRVTMTKYFFKDFNTNPLQDLIGNGINSVGDYGNKIAYLGQNKGLCITDVLPTNIFLFFGIVGLLLYTLLFFAVLRSKVTPDCMFAKMMVIYMYLIGPTNVALLSISPMIFAMSLYIVKEGINFKEIH